jgi:hypothetical protein
MSLKKNKSKIIKKKDKKNKKKRKKERKRKKEKKRKKQRKKRKKKSEIERHIPIQRRKFFRNHRLSLNRKIVPNIRFVHYEVIPVT